MLNAFVATVLIFIFLVLAETAWRRGMIKGEVSRKLVHVIVGSFVAFWPFFTDRLYVVLLAVAFLAVITISWRFRIFKAIHSVRRRGIGEILFPIGILLVAIYADSNWVFTASILHLSLADGLAAVVGTAYGKANGYKIFGQVKSLAGTATFFITSMLITQSFLLFSGVEIEPGLWLLAVLLPLTATALENVSPYGSDNILIPGLVLLVLNGLV